MDNICIGTAQFGMEYGIANKEGQPKVDEIKRIVETVSKNNIFFYDTAVSYGSSEAVLGAVFSDLNITEKVKCITKLSPDFTFTSYNDLKKTVSQSLDRLQVNSLWGLLIHRTKVKGNWQHFTNAIKKLKKEKIIKNFGVSIYQPEDALRFAGEEDIDIIQVPFNILDRRFLDNNFFDIAMKNKKQVFIRSVFLQGLLLMDEDQLINKKMDWALPYLSHFNSFIQHNCIGNKAFALKTVQQSFPYLKLIIGLDSHNQLLENMKILKSKQLPDEIISNWWANLPEYPERLLNPSLW
jgi:aryl-alcohol dehydrogenase-like predicted oxidoreductase